MGLHVFQKLRAMPRGSRAAILAQPECHSREGWNSVIGTIIMRVVSRTWAFLYWVPPFAGTMLRCPKDALPTEKSRPNIILKCYAFRCLNPVALAKDGHSGAAPRAQLTGFRVARLARAAIPAVLVCGGGFLTLAPAEAQVTMQPPHRPTIILGRKHPGRIDSLAPEGVIVDLRDGGKQVVQFTEIWRIRRAFASDEPANTAVIDFANNRLFVATPVANLIADVGKTIAIVQLTAPNGETVYMAANKITDIFNSLPGLHNPLSKTVIGTRDGTQQVLEPAGEVKRIVASARTAQ
jgi:hypothetical protein